MPNKVIASMFVVILGLFATFYVTIPCISTQKDIFYPALFYKGLLIALSWKVISRLGIKRKKGHIFRLFKCYIIPTPASVYMLCKKHIHNII